MTTTGRRATATVATATSIRWNFLETGRIVGGVRTGAGGRRGGVIALSMTEAGRPPDTGAETGAGEQRERPESDQWGGLVSELSVCFQGEVSPQRQQEVPVT